ncbi:hypothetical protein PybrP1_003462 [[Pythium] brassicae (nom. inval.)]|nr:hypothetical protein PybrP1_003462 [[Pythium] brassicae (nom. inval.)]
MDSAYTEATDAHTSSAMKKVALYLREHNGGVIGVHGLMAARVDKDMVGKFDVFLVKDPSIGFSSTSTYLSSVKRQLEDATGTSFFKDNKGWYKRLRQTLRKCYVEATVGQGQPLQDKAPLMTISDLRELSLRLLDRQDAISALALQWSLVGRSSDVGDLRFAQLQWTGSCVLVHVHRMKTQQEHSVSVPPATLQRELGPIHPLAAHLATDCYCLSELIVSQLGFDTIRQNKVASYINRVMESTAAAGKDCKLTPRLRTHSSSCGAAAHAASYLDIYLSDLAHRGRWAVDGFHTLRKYISETALSDQKVGRALAGWETPSRRVHPAQLDDSGSSAASQRLFASLLFRHYKSQIVSNSFTQALAAALLLCSRGVLVQRGRDSRECVRWSTSVRARFVRCDLHALPVASSASSTIDPILHLNLGDALVQLSSAQQEMAGEVAGVGTKLDQVASAVSQLVMMQKEQSRQQRTILEMQHQQEEMLVETARQQTVTLSGRPASSKRQTTSNKSQLALDDNRALGPQKPSQRPDHSPQQWPRDLTSLRGWSLSSLLFRAWVESLALVPIGHKCSAQRDMRRALTLARHLIGDQYPVRVPNMSDAEWEDMAREAAVGVQRVALEQFVGRIDRAQR